jgi:hypothetical protein
MVEYEETDEYGDISALLDACRVVARVDSTVTRSEEQEIVLSLGTGPPIFYEVLGEEFQQTLMCLAHTQAFYESTTSFVVGEWVCIGRPGTYWGDVGLVQSLSDQDGEDRITVVLVPRIINEADQSFFNKNFARPTLREDLRPHTSDDPPLSTDGEETWLLGRDRMTKDGMLLRSFAPWELRKDMADGGDLYLVPEQDDHFRRFVPPEDWHLMPAQHHPHRHLMAGERVEVAGHRGIIEGFYRLHDAWPDTEYVRMYSETCKQHVLCHPSFLVKRHTEGDAVFSFEFRENVVISECDYLKQEVKIQLRATVARRYKKASLVSIENVLPICFGLIHPQIRVVHPNSLRSPFWHVTLASQGDGVVYQPLLERFLEHHHWRSTLTDLWRKRAVYVIGDPRVKGHILEVRTVERVPDSVARAAPLSSGVTLTLYDSNVTDGKHTWQVDYDMVRDYM